MSIDFDHERIRGLLAAAALGAVDPGEREGVEAHLRGCRSCRAEHLRYQWTATALSGTSDRVWDQVADTVATRRVQLDRLLRELVSLYDPGEADSEARVVVASDTHSVALGRYIAEDRRFAVVGVAADVLDAVSMTAAHEPDLLLLSLSRPRPDWLSAVSTVTEWSPGTKILLISGVDAAKVAGMVLHAGEAGAWRDKPAEEATEPVEETPSSRGKKIGFTARRSIIDEAMWHIGIGPRTGA
ncbi:MAG TPA: zf-HC2 domain-containing protein [Acidimicrobiales bacterium]|nr:zf-HC2 domain-containing protein [Acidimicrobiales bacterium]